MKYYDAVSIPGEVIRIIPPRTKEKENRIYFEFLDFYEVSKVNYIWFSNTGSFGKLLTVMKKSRMKYGRKKSGCCSAPYTPVFWENIRRAAEKQLPLRRECIFVVRDTVWVSGGL